MVEVIERPQREIYSTANPSVYDEPIYTSFWNAGWLPIRYKIESNLFPFNSSDTVYTISSINSRNGFARIVLSTNASYNRLDYLTIDTPVYSGVFQIKEVVDANEYVLNVAYTSSSTGTAVKYYNNYNVKVKVYAGIPDYHELNADDPMSLVAELQVVPDISNIALIDVSDLVRDKLNADNVLEQTNNLNAWTSFRIAYAESYDVSDGVNITAFTDSFTNDTYDSCNANAELVDNSFTSGLTSWSQGVIGAVGTQAWQGASGYVFIVPDSSPSSDKASQLLYQDYSIVKGIEYRITATFTSTNVNSARIFVQVVKNGVPFTILSQLTLTGAFDFLWLADDNYESIGFFVNCTSFAGSPEYRLNAFNLQVNAGCEAYLFASNSVRQFQNSTAGNMWPYIQSVQSEGQFMTYFDPVPLFDRYQDISTIIPAELFRSLGNAGFFGRKVTEYDASGAVIQTSETIISGEDDGVYRFRLDDLPLNANTAYFDFALKTPINGNYGLTFAGGTGPSARYATGTTPSGLEFGLADDVSFSFQILRKLTDTEGSVLFTNFSAADQSNRWIITSLPFVGGFTIGLSLENGIESALVLAQDISYDEIHDIVIVKDGSTVTDWKIYVDGANQSVINFNNLSSYTPDTSTQYSIGTYSGAINPLQCTLFSVRAFNEALSLAQVQSLSDKNVSIASTIFDLKFAEGEGNTIVDYIGEFNATLTGFTLAERTRGDSNLWVYADTLGPVNNLDDPNEYSPFTDVLISETKRISLASTLGLDRGNCLGGGTSDATGAPIYLTWLNDLGGWEYFQFNGRKTYSEEHEGIEIERNIFNNWPDGFSDGETMADWIRVSSIRSVVVRSGLLTKAQYDAVIKIRKAIRVQQIMSDNSKVTVLVEKNGFEKYTDGDKQYIVEFEIKYPKDLVQGQ